MIASCDHFRREPYLCKRGRVRTWTSSTSHADAFAHAGNNSKKLGRRLACTRLAAIRSHGMIVRPECGRRPIQKARDRFPGAGFVILAMMKICRLFARREIGRAACRG